MHNNRAGDVVMAQLMISSYDINEQGFNILLGLIEARCIRR